MVKSTWKIKGNGSNYTYITLKLNYDIIEVFSWKYMLLNTLYSSAIQLLAIHIAFETMHCKHPGQAQDRPWDTPSSADLQICCS